MYIPRMKLVEFPNMLLIFLLLIPQSSPSPSPLLNDQILGLILFKSGLHDPSSSLSSWSPDSPSPCSWPHITCSSSSSHSVSSISLSSPSISLSSPSFPLGLPLLPSLLSLSLSLPSNSLPSPFPPSTSLPCPSLLSLSLSSLLLSGPIHPSLSNCSLLLHLNLSSNNLSGDFSFLFSSLTRLRVLDLSFNSLSGPLPPSISSLHFLSLLNLSGNLLSGRLPLSFPFLPHIASFDLSHNRFHGPLPKWISFFTRIRRIDFSHNRFGGVVEANLSLLKNLNFLDLSFNFFRGRIMDDLAKSLSLVEVRLGGNEFSGTLPMGVLGMGLKVLDLAGNKLGGEIFNGGGKKKSFLEVLNLSGNRFVGEFLVEMELFSNLRYLNLSFNDQLHSRLLSQIGEFRNLSVVDLRNSGFYGEIPADICNSASLNILQLDGNNFSGKIPEQMGNCSNLHLLSLSHNNLTGSIPTSFSKLKKLQILNLEFNNLNGKIPLQLGSLPNLLALNISNNRLSGLIPQTGIFPSLDKSALQGNLALCSPLLSDEPCDMGEIPKPLVLDPNTINKAKKHKPKPSSQSQQHLLSLSSIIAISAASIIFSGILLISLLNISARKRIKTIPSNSKIITFGSKNPTFSNLNISSLLTKQNEIGRGTFGVVYRSAGQIAIRKFFPNYTLQNHDEFDREVRQLAKARHMNLLHIKGYFFTLQMQLILTEFAAGGSLCFRVHEGGTPLSWPERFRVALGAARGLAYLHRSSVIHCNVKSSNILLDDRGEAKVGDFGLNRLAGLRTEGLSEKCDVFGFGIVLLEIVTGRKGENLVDEVMGEIERGETEECVDRKMGGFVEEEAVPVLKLGLVCASRIASSRPTMAEVVQIMEVIKAPVVETMVAFSS